MRVAKNTSRRKNTRATMRAITAATKSTAMTAPRWCRGWWRWLLGCSVASLLRSATVA